ncbi:MAG TPA: sugar nucleotide-binding protein [Lacipirellulaceae bacterium]|nr:sugar nucleotide-binding protein [Lacipirellulaceae bacterium]
MSANLPALEMWGGIECTVNRVGDQFYDQLAVSGHERRLDDLELFADLGIRALRYPMLWERAEAAPGAAIDWSWSDVRLARLRQRGVRPILGLVHHGSGPAHTNLLCPSFAEGLAAFAARVAKRYPWVDAYTPVNEPLTTARFSALYGHWYPHARDTRAFCEALLNECQATVLAMQSIRRVNPAAQLIQTEDIGKTHSVPELAYQADFENNRRWLTWDLLCGRVDRRHLLWEFLVHNGASPARLLWCCDNPLPPDVLGLNYYVTSERFLDTRVDRYPSCSHGGNGRHAYADVEAVRVLADGMVGTRGILAEAWERYRRPIAITEVHLGCTREEQMRWLVEAWNAAQAVRGAGAEIRAITAWSLLGAYDWNSLLTRWEGAYEPGVFDLRSSAPRATALASVVGTLARGAAPAHPVLDSPGWWRRKQRLLYPPATVPTVHQVAGPLHAAARAPAPAPDAPPERLVLITGGRGALAQAFSRICTTRGLAFRLLAHEELDIADNDQVHAALSTLRPWAVINAAGYVNVDAAEHDCESCYRANRLGPAVVAEACREHNVALLTFSSAMVFNGQSQRPYVEDDRTAPLNVYGRDKEAAERAVLRRLPEALIVRSSAFFGPWDDRNFISRAVAEVEAGRPVRADADATVSPTYIPDLAHACLDLLIDGEHGIWHLSSGSAMTWAELARRALDAADMRTARVVGCHTCDLGLVAPRPRFSALGSVRGTSLLPPLEDALRRYPEQREEGALC